MKPSNLVSMQSIRQLILACFCALAIYGCSGASDSGNGEIENGSESTLDTVNGGTGTPNEDSNVAGMDVGSGMPVSGEESESTDSGEPPVVTQPIPVVTEPSSPATTRVDFDITVPAFMSDELQVRLTWGDINTTAAWVRDENWAISETFPASTENPLVVTFSDRNGSITLGTFEITFTTGTDEAETFQISAGQFDTARWDSDNDGISNLDELVTGTDPLEIDSAISSAQLPSATQVNLELVQDKTFRISWQPSEGADFYRVMENPDGLSGFSQVSNDLELAVQTFDHRVALYKRFNASYIVQSCNASGCIDSDAIVVSGTLEQAIGYFKASNTEFENYFGDKVSLSRDGNTLVVGASGRDISNRGGESDAVYVFQRTNGSWLLQAVLNSNADDGFAAGFGSDISLSADGNILAIGAKSESSDTTLTGGDPIDRSGAVYVFVLVDGSWQQRSYLTASNPGTEDYFGSSVSLSEDGSTLAIGALYEDSASSGVNADQDDNSATSAGAVYVFQNNDEEWIQQAYIKASNADAMDSFGRAISISADGNTLAVAAASESSGSMGINGDQTDNSVSGAGAVYIFFRNGEVWRQQAYLKASNTGLDDFFGRAVSLSMDGSTLAVGAVSENSGSTGVNGDQDNDSSPQAGAVYMFQRSDGEWRQQAYLKASNTVTISNNVRGALFGGAVSISGDGNTLAVGAAHEASFSTGINGDQSLNPGFLPGAVYVFERSGGEWRQQAYVKASNTDSGDRFGSAVSLSLDGNSLAVGAFAEQSFATGVNGDQTDNSGQSKRVGASYLY